MLWGHLLMGAPSFPRPAIRFPTSHANECAQSSCWAFLQLGRGALRACGDLDAPLASSRVCGVSASPGGVGTALANLPCPPFQPHPFLSRSLSVLEPSLNSLEPLLLQVHRSENRSCPLKNGMGTRGAAGNASRKAIPFDPIQVHLQEQPERCGWKQSRA